MQEVVERSEENGPDTNALVPHLAQGQDHMSARQVVQDGANCMSSAGLHAECSGNGTGGLGSLQKIAADVEDTEKLADGGNEDEGNDGQSASLSRLKGKVLHTHKPRSMNAPRRLHKDSASWCWFCKHVFWSGITVEDCDGAAPSFCTLCGSKLLPGARDAGSYSRLAQTTDDEIMSLMRKEVAKEGGLGAVEKFSHPGVGLPELREQIETMSLSCRNQANGKDRPRSNFCDICGHGGTHIQCSRCPASFHRTCMVLPANYPLPKEGWWCSACMHEAVRSEEIKPLTLVPRACKRTLPSIAQCCSSCGYPEIESLNCDACSRWFCYGCMCVSHECVPAGAWACPECIGQKVYDENLSERIRISRERWVAGKMSAKERDGFSQMVFDLLCSCAWGEWKVNVEALITDNCARLARDASYLPTILPFQSLHYPLPKGDMMKISQAYAKVVQLKAHRAYRSAETRTKWAEEGEEVRRKGEDGGRAADEKGIRACSAAASARASPAPPLGDVAVDLSSLGAMPRFRDCEAKGREGEEDDEGAPPAAVALQACEAEDVLGGIGAGSSRVSGHVDNLPAAQQPSKEQPSNGPESVLGVLAARPSSGAPLPEINMWKPELCERTAGRGSAGMPRLRIGYMSSDFVNHPTADLIIRALLLHNTEEFETFCYSLAKDDNSTYRRMLEQGIPNFRLMPKHLSDRKCAEMIAEDGIHILVNLNGHTAGDRNGVCALRPAPLQVVYLAYPGTMGADYIDYNVVDRYVCPDEHREFYTENLLYMPHSYQANSFNDLYREILRPETLPKRSDFMLPEDAFVFCNFCRLGRITEELFQVWLRIMQEVPHSVLWLYKHPRAAMYRLQEAARQTDPALVQRIMFASPCSPKLEHLKRVALADLCLDTTVYNGHTTGSDMLWAGVPMLTVLGDNWPSRVAYCLAQCIDMPEMVVRNLQEYEEAAVRLARDPPTLRRWREKLASKRLSAPLFDTERWVRSFEDGLHQMWDMWANGHHSRQTLGDIVCRDFGESPSAARKRDEYAKFGALRGSPSWTRAGGDSDKDSANPHGYSFGDGLSVPRGAPAVRTSSSRARAGKHDEHRLSKCRTGGAGRERELKDIRHGGNGHVASAPRAGPLASSAGAGASAVPAGAVAQKRLRGRPPQCPTRQHAEPVLGVVQASQNSKRKVAGQGQQEQKACKRRKSDKVQESPGRARDRRRGPAQERAHAPSQRSSASRIDAAERERRSRPCDRGARSEPGEDSSPSILVEPISWRTSAGEVSRGRTGLRMRGAGLPSARLSKRRRASRRATSSSPSSRAPQEPVQRGIPFSIFLPNDMWSEDDGRDGGREEQAAVLLAEGARQEGPCRSALGSIGPPTVESDAGAALERAGCYDNDEAVGLAADQVEKARLSQDMEQTPAGDRPNAQTSREGAFAAAPNPDVTVETVLECAALVPASLQFSNSANTPAGSVCEGVVPLPTGGEKVTSSLYVSEPESGDDDR